MKKTTLTAIANYLTEKNDDYMMDVLAEVTAELTKGEEAKAKNAEAYESVHSLIVDSLSDTPVTCAELWESIEDSVPEGMTKGKVQYALSHLWQDEIVKIEGKPNTYRRA